MEAEPQISLSAVAALSSKLLEGGTLDEQLRHVCGSVVDAIEGATASSVSLVTGGACTTYGATSGLSIEADERQYEQGAGPCLDAARGNQPVVVDDTHLDDRWPAVLSAHAAAGIRSSMSFPLPIQGESIGALNVFGAEPNAFEDDKQALGSQLASFAAVVVANAMAYENVAESARNMQLAMDSRAVIEQAKGVIMARAGCDAGAAFNLLVEQSQHENRKLREIAVELVARAGRPAD